MCRKIEIVFRKKILNLGKLQGGLVTQKIISNILSISDNVFQISSLISIIFDQENLMLTTRYIDTMII